MRVDRATGELLHEEGGDAAEAGADVLPLRPSPQSRQPRPGSRRATISDSSTISGDDAKLLTQHARVLEVEGSIDRLGLAEQRTTLAHSEAARRLLTQDLVDSRERHEADIDRVRDEYERASAAAEARHGREALRWRDDRDRLQRECDELSVALKDAKRSKKKHKRSVQEAEYKLAELQESGKKTRSTLALLAPGVPPLAAELARNLPMLFGFIRSVVPGIGAVAAASGNDETVLDRAAAIRFAGRLFDSQNELAVGVLEDLEHLAFDVVHRGGEDVIVPEWDRVRRHIWAALRREADAGDEQREVVDHAQVAHDTEGE